MAAIQKISCHMGFAETGEVQYTVKVQGVIQTFSTQPTSLFGAAPSPFSIECKGLSIQNLLYLVNSTGNVLDQTRGIEMQAGTNRALNEGLVNRPFKLGPEGPLGKLRIRPFKLGPEGPLGKPFLSRPFNGPTLNRPFGGPFLNRPLDITPSPSLISAGSLDRPPLSSPLNGPLLIEPEIISEDLEEQSPFNNDPVFPPGFEDYELHTSLTVPVQSEPKTPLHSKANLSTSVRRSRRIKERNNGAYLTATKKAEQLKSINRGAATVRTRLGTSKKSNFKKPSFKYLEDVDPLTGCQAELVVSAAGVEIDAALEKKINQAIGKEGGELP